MTVLDRKLLRDLRTLRGQVVTVALLIGAGVAVLVMSVSAYLSLRGAQQSFYTETRFAEVYAKGPTVVFFYPKANTPGCTAQACSLRDAFAELQQQGVQVLGVSTDGAEAQQKFKTQHRLPYDLIADPDGKILAAFGVGKVLGLLPFASRQCFLIRKGRIVWHDASASTATQADDIRRVLKEGR